MAIKLTQPIVDRESAKAVKGVKAFDLIDSGCPGLLLRIGPRGASWALKFEGGGQTWRMRLGTPAMLTLSEARVMAAKARALIENRLSVPDDTWLFDRMVELGKAAPRPPKPERDPVLIAQFEAEAAASDLWTWEEAMAAFLAEVQRTKRPATWVDYGKMLRIPELAALAGRKAKNVSRQDLARVVHEIHSSGRERQAEHVASVLRPMWSYLGRDGLQHRSGVTVSMAGLKAPERSAGTKTRANGKIPGGHVATPEEVGFVLAAARCGVLEPTLAMALELLVLTGQRRRAVAGALVADFVHWEENEGWGVWSMGPAHRKTADKQQDRHRHVLPLPPSLWSSLQYQFGHAYDAGSPYLFPQVRPSRGDTKAGHLSDAALNHRLLDLGVKASPHDLRRGLSSHCQTQLRQARSTVKMILDHAEGIRSDDVLEKFYTQDDRLDLKAPLMEAWCNWADERAAATVLPENRELQKGIARRRRERELAGRGKRTKPPIPTPIEQPDQGFGAALRRVLEDADQVG